MRRSYAFRLCVIGAALTLARAVAAKTPMSDAEASRRVDEAQRLFADGGSEAAAYDLGKLLKARPDDSQAATLLCEIRTTQADTWELAPATSMGVREKYRIAVAACASASTLEKAPDAAARSLWAHDAARLGQVEGALTAYRAWAEAEPNEPQAVGGLAAWLERAGRTDEADAVLARAGESSPAFLQHVRFNYACHAVAPARADRVGPVLDAMTAVEQGDEGRLMIDVLRQALDPDFTRALLAFLDLIDRHALSEGSARSLWSCLDVDDRWRELFAGVPSAGDTIPTIVSHREPKFPSSGRWSGRDGRVVLLVRISAEGKVDVVWRARSSGTAYDAAAVLAVGDWTYRPATRAGRPRPYPFLIRVDFKLD